MEKLCPRGNAPGQSPQPFLETGLCAIIRCRIVFQA